MRAYLSYLHSCNLDGHKNREFASILVKSLSKNTTLTQLLFEGEWPRTMCFVQLLTRTLGSVFRNEVTAVAELIRVNTTVVDLTLRGAAE